MENYSKTMIYGEFPKYADIADVRLCDGFFSDFTSKIRTVSVPDILKKFLADGSYRELQPRWQEVKKAVMRSSVVSWTHL